MKRVSTSVGLVLAAALIAGCSATQAEAGDPAPTDAPAIEKVRFTVFPGALASMGVYIADAMGFFEAEGLEIEYVNASTGTSSIQLLVGNQTDFAITDVPAVANARASGADVVLVAGQFTRFSGQLVCREGAISSDASYPEVMAALEGRKVGITGPGSSTDTYTRYSLIDAGVDPSEVEILPIGGIPQLLAALESEAIDCATAYQPMQLQLTDDRVIVDWQGGEGPAAFGDYLYNAIGASASFAEENPEIIERLGRAMSAAADFGNDPGNAEAIAAATIGFFEGLSEEDLATTTKQIAGTYGAAITDTQIDNCAKVYEAAYGKPLGVKREDIVAAAVSGS